MGVELFKRISDAFQTVWDMTDSHIKLLKETCDMRHKIRKYPTSVTSASDAYKKFLTEMLLVISVLQLQLKLAIDNNNNDDGAAKGDQMDKIIKYLVDAHDVLSKQKAWKGISPDQINKAVIRHEWKRYIDLLREKQQQLDGMMVVLSQCRPYALFETAWQSHAKLWSEIMVEAADDIPLSEIVKRVDQTGPPQ